MIDFEQLLAAPTQANKNTFQDSVDALRWHVLCTPCPPELRGRLWKIFLNLEHISAGCYVSLVHRGPSALDDKIRNDTNRTLATDSDFLKHVSEDMLIRLLNAFVWIVRPDGRSEDTSEELQWRARIENESPVKDLTYVQGMNVIAAPFLMALPEMEAYFAFSTFVSRHCPLYIQPTMKGAYCGLKLVDMCLQVLDPELYCYLLNKNLTASMYAFPSVVTFSACTPPISELMRLWDFMFAFGFHLNILYIVAQLAIVRQDILNSPNPMKVLKKFPPLNAEYIISLTKSSCQQLPRKLYGDLVRHAYDESVADRLDIRVGIQGNAMPDRSPLPPFIANAQNGVHTNRLMKPSALSHK